MKVLHLQPPEDGSPTTLHPRLTVARTGNGPDRGWLVTQLEAIAGGGSLDAEGEIEAHGIRFPLRRDQLAMLDLSAPVPSVVRDADLPGHDPAISEAAAARQAAELRRHDAVGRLDTLRSGRAEADAARESAVAERDELARGGGPARAARAESDARRSRAEAEVRAAEQGLAAQERSLTDVALARDMAAEARASAAERLERSRESRRAAMAAAMAAAGAVEQARPLAANDPSDAHAAAMAELAAAEAAADEADPDRDASPLNRRLAELEGRRAEIHRLQEAMGESATGAVRDALTRLEDASSEPQPVVAALALADTWRDLHQQIRALDTGLSPEETAAEGRVHEARRALVEAEADYNQPVLTPEQIAKVEAAHQAVLDAQDRTETRFGGGRSRKKLEDLRSEERRVLERLGFSTYADYMMSSSSRGVGPANRAIVDTAKARLVEAQAELEALPGAAERARRRSELLQRRDAVAPRVSDLLGHDPTGPEAEDELRALRESVAPDRAAVNELGRVLSGVGIAVPEDPIDREDAVLLARAYLAEEQDAELRRTEAEEAVDALDDHIVALREARDRGEKDLPTLEDLPSLAQPVIVDAEEAARAVTLREARWADVEAARARVAELEAAVEAHRRAVSDLGGLEADLVAAGEAESRAADAVAAAEADLALANGSAFDEAVDAVGEAEAATGRARQRLAEARRNLDEAEASSPVEALLADAEKALAEATATAEEAAAAEKAAEAELADVDAELEAVAVRERAAHEAVAEVDRTGLLDQVHWALLGRLAAVRSVGLGGSVPLVLDDPFGAFDDAEVAAVLDRLAPLVGAVQVVLVTDRQAAVDWAARADPDAVALV